jgi:predicted Zn-dependent peptidase
MTPDRAPVDLPYTKRTLDNGLDVIVHEDHHVPIVAVNLWYHVGSKNELPGRTGFAHLFEHLMFEGSEHQNSGYFAPLQAAGGQLCRPTPSIWPCGWSRTAWPTCCRRSPRSASRRSGAWC